MSVDQQLEERVRQAGAALVEAAPIGVDFEDLTKAHAASPRKRISGGLAFVGTFAAVLAFGSLIWLASGDSNSGTDPESDAAVAPPSTQPPTAEPETPGLSTSEIESALPSLVQILSDDTNVQSYAEPRVDIRGNGSDAELWVVVDTASAWTSNRQKQVGAWETIRSIATLYSPESAWHDSAPNIRFIYDTWPVECSGEFMVALAVGAKTQGDWDAECRSESTSTASEAQQTLPPVIRASVNSGSLLEILEASGRRLTSVDSGNPGGMRLEAAIFSDGTGLIDLTWRDWPPNVDLRNVLPDETTFHQYDGVELSVREHPEDNQIDVGVYDGKIYATVHTTFTDDMDLATTRDLALEFYQGVVSNLPD